jgi:hypothetical protein
MTVLRMTALECIFRYPEMQAEPPGKYSSVAL